MSDAPAPLIPRKGSSPFITGIGIAQICSWGSLYYSFPQVAAAMEKDLGWSSTQLYGAATASRKILFVQALPAAVAVLAVLAGV